MTEENDDRKLEQLFEHSAAEPSSFELTRMAARARELPARLERVPRRLPRWTWAPAFAAFAALGALGVTLSQAPSPEDEPSSHPPRPPVPAKALATEAPENASAHASATSPGEGVTGPKLPEDEADLDALSLTPESDDDPFDLTILEETELAP